MDHAFGVIPKNSLPNSMLPMFSPVLSSSSLIVFQFKFRPIIHFEIIFVKDSFSSFLLHVDIQLFQNNLLKTVFAPLYCFQPFVKKQLTTFMWLFLCFLFCSINLVCFFTNILLS